VLLCWTCVWGDALVVQGNIQGWGGPLVQDFIDAQHALQLNILNATRSYGMINVSVLRASALECQR
jgi:hypothetical protein